MNKIMLNFYFLGMVLLAFIIIIVDSLLIFKARLWSLIVAHLVLKSDIVLLAVQKDLIGLV